MGRLWSFLLVTLCLLSLGACSPLSQVQAQDRLFADMSLELVDTYTLPATGPGNLPLGGLSGWAYDRQQDLFYAVSDDKQKPRFYTLKADWSRAGRSPQLKKIEIKNATLLKDAQGNPLKPNQWDLEGIALSPEGALWVSSEGARDGTQAPFLAKFDRQSGQLLETLTIPSAFIPGADPPRGLRKNLGFEALALAPGAALPSDPYRLFTVPESALAQDLDPDAPPERLPLRWLHYLVNSGGPAVLLAEHLYYLDPPPSGTLLQGLSEIAALSREGIFLSLERALDLTGFSAKLFQVVNANATDTRTIASFQGNIADLVPLQKRLLLDLNTLDLELDNLEGMTLGPRFPDGTESLWLISDNNFRQDQVIQILVFRLRG
ncbi:MAG: esterase-like activity of phytase family protein [Cyanobacteriota bacterium]|jgi:hypothetical protein